MDAAWTFKSISFAARARTGFSITVKGPPIEVKRRARLVFGYRCSMLCLDTRLLNFEPGNCFSYLLLIGLNRALELYLWISGMWFKLSNSRLHVNDPDVHLLPR